MKRRSPRRWAMIWMRRSMKRRRITGAISARSMPLAASGGHSRLAEFVEAPPALARRLAMTGVVLAR